MKKLFILLNVFGVVLLCFGLAQADIIYLQPTPTDLNDLDHSHAYEWKINYTIPAGYKITAVSLIFKQISNWDGSRNVLFLDLLDKPSTITSGNVKTYNDTDNGWTDYFFSNAFTNSNGTAKTNLTAWWNLSSTPSNKTYSFTNAQIGILNSYIKNGNNFSLAFDPDCHFYNDGIKLKIETAHAPLPGGFLLLGSGLAGLIGVVRRRIKP